MERTREATYQRKYREKLNQINKTNAAFMYFAEIRAPELVGIFSDNNNNKKILTAC